MYRNKISCSAIAGDGDDRGDSIAGDGNDGESRYAKFIGDSCRGVTGSIEPHGGLEVMGVML